jgi:hypothetical protein
MPSLPAATVIQRLTRSSNAKIAGMQTDLNLSSDSYQWLLTIFYISYILFEWFALMVNSLSPLITPLSQMLSNS